MMRFRCPHCQQTLEVVAPTELFLCPACELWCRIPVAEELKPSQEETRPIPRPAPRPYDEPRLAPSPPEPIPFDRSQAITTRQTDEVPFRFQDEADDVQFEIVVDGEKRRRRRRRRRRRGFGFAIDLDYWVSPSLILLVLLVPGGFFFVIFSFLLHPGAGFGAFLMVGGSLWLAFIAVEDSLATALMVLFVPFYSWYYAFSNFERIAAPFALRILGGIVFVVSLVASALNAHGAWSMLPSLPPEMTRPARRITSFPLSATAISRLEATSAAAEEAAGTPREEFVASLAPIREATDR